MNIFRKLRKQFAVDNQFLKYARYAFGEIFLIVIGIFIALQLNNWNDHRKNRELEASYYNRILDDFKMDRAVINTMMGRIDKRVETSRTLLLELDQQSKTKYYILNGLLKASRSDMFVPLKNTFTDLTSSGNLNILKDIELKNSLIKYYSDLENKLLHIKKNREKMVSGQYALGPVTQIGIYEFDYMQSVLDKEIIDTLAHVDWHKDPESEYYVNYQNFMILNIAMNIRIKNHLQIIDQKMELPFQLLIKKVNEKE